MTKYIALLRAVNVGGTGKLPMSELRAMCCDAGFTRVQTYIASGNVVFQSEATPSKIQVELEARLQAFSGKPARVIVRSEREMLAVLKANPFPKAAPNSTYVVFLSEPPPSDALAHASGQKDEQISLGKKRDLHSIWQRHGPLQIANSGGEDRHGPQYEHSCQTCGDGD